MPSHLKTVDESEDRRQFAAVIRRLEGTQAPSKLAILIRLAEGLAQEDRSTESEIALDRLFWRGVEDLSREVLHEFEELQQIIGAGGDFVTIENKPGGAR